MAEDAAKLAKADLVTGMVGEFPELQGVMGGYYARAQGYPDEVADAIRDHYKPVGQGDEVPTAPVTVAVSLADKLDIISTFFGAGLRPTGSSDPYALRRAMIGLLRITQEKGIRFRLAELVEKSVEIAIQVAAKKEHYVLIGIEEQHGIYRFFYFDDRSKGVFREELNLFGPGWLVVVPVEYLGWTQSRKADLERDAYAWFRPSSQTALDVVDFFADRLKVQQREAGVRHDLIDAVFALGGEDDLVRLLARVKALQSFIATEDGANLLVGYRRAANIVRIEEKKDGASPSRHPELVSGSIDADAASPAESEVMDPGLRRDDGVAGSTSEPAEAALIAALDIAEPKAAAAVAAEDFEGAMAALASLRGPIDAFFDQVTVNDPDRDKRAARLALLDRIRAAVHKVADFSKIEG
jgi:glycyl-tRNA synthetase beta chain